MLGSRTGDVPQHADHAADSDCVLLDVEKSLSSLPSLRHSGPVITGCLASAITTDIHNLLRDPEVGCDHAVVYRGTCLACVENIGDLYGDKLDYLEKGLRVSRLARGTLRKMVTQSFLGVRKLHLVLDLDRTLLQTVLTSELSPDEERLKTLAERYDVSEPTGDLFISEEGHRITKLRPFVRSFLKEASAMFDLTVYTMSSRSHAKKVVRLLDPGRSYFGNRVIALGSSTTPTTKKSLDDVLAEPSCTLILDDSYVWPDHTRNLILAKRYTFFASKRHTQSRDLPPTQPGVPGDGNYLENALEVLKSVHQRYFNLYDCGDRGAAADVRSELSALRRDVLKDCQIFIPSCFDGETRMARELGAVVHSTRCSSLTHVVSQDPNADHFRWALEQNKFLVHPDWVFAAFQQWRRPPEHVFAPGLANSV